MRSSLKNVLAVGSVGAVLALAAMPSALAQPENPRPRLPGQAPRVPAQPGEGQQPGFPGQPGRGPGEGGQRQMTVGGAMRQMNRALSMYEDAVAEGEEEQALLSVYAFERACASAKLSPAPKEATEDQIHAFREALLGIMKYAVELEEAQFTGDAEKAAELVDEIKELRDKTHDAFGVEEDEEDGAPAEPAQPGGPGLPRPGRGG
ncbi:MAG: hypothetical protein IT439_03520 [Phycisphaerales bacterium]|nr:hypothetical protein [Phycisphaerales bacterium]